MNTQEAYNQWASQYDSNHNKTRDLEGIALRKTLLDYKFIRSLEMGCGTGKNSAWLNSISSKHTAIDFSEEMLEQAKLKNSSSTIEFIKADLTQPWELKQEQFDLISFSLVLEHIQELNHIFSESNRVLKKDGYIYIGELHPYKQYAGSKARFETAEGMHYPECFTHSISEYTQTAKKYNFQLLDLNKYYDDEPIKELPRIITFLFQKTNEITS